MVWLGRQFDSEQITPTWRGYQMLAVWLLNFEFFCLFVCTCLSLYSSVYVCLSTCLFVLGTPILSMPIHVYLSICPLECLVVVSYRSCVSFRIFFLCLSIKKEMLSCNFQTDMQQRHESKQPDKHLARTFLTKFGCPIPMPTIFKLWHNSKEILSDGYCTVVCKGWK